jgi:hypothetical protein
MTHRLARLFRADRVRLFAIGALASAAMIAATGCSQKPEKPPVVEPAIKALPPKPVADWLKGSIYEQVELLGIEPLRVSNYGVVVNLRGTGDSTASNSVRDYVVREMTRRGVGNPNNDEFRRVSPTDLLNDPRVAIVRVDTLVPPGAYQGQRTDVVVTALEENNTTSLSGGTLWQTDLSPGGANPANPGELVTRQAVAWGPIFVNPAYALDPDLNDPRQRNSLRRGIVMNGGLVQNPRPLVLRIRAAETRIARMVEARIREQFQRPEVAAAQDVATVLVNVDPRYRDDWRRFAGVMLHTYFNRDSGFAFEKSKQLAAEMQKPDAPLEALSYAMEALGPPALPTLVPLMDHADPLVAYAAARAAAYLNEPTAPMRLAQLARNPSNPVRLLCVQTLGKLPNAPSLTQYLRDLLDVPESTVRIEAYKALTGTRDPIVTSVVIGDQKFILDLVPSKQPTIVYASRLGTPRIAIIGRELAIRTPLMFAAQKNELTISDSPDRKALTIFYRGAGVAQPVRTLIPPELTILLARLGGTGPRNEIISLNYPEVIAVLGQLADRGALIEPASGTAIATATPAQFVLQDLPGLSDVDNASPLDAEPQGRPIGEAADAPSAAPATQPAAAAAPQPEGRAIR